MSALILRVSFALWTGSVTLRKTAVLNANKYLLCFDAGNSCLRRRRPQVAVLLCRDYSRTTKCP